MNRTLTRYCGLQKFNLILCTCLSANVSRLITNWAGVVHVVGVASPAIRLTRNA